MERRGVPLLAIAALISGCVIGGGGGYIPPDGTVERAVVDSERAYMLHQAEIYDSLADKLEGGEVMDSEKARRETDQASLKAFQEDLAPVAKIIDGAAEQSRVGMRQARVFKAIASGYRKLAER